LNKFTGECNFSFNPGYFFFNSPISASPVIYGDSLFISGHDGYLYSLNDQKNEAPASIFLYYAIVIIIVFIAVI
jgi:outer membrane protein assembly factor BamB